MNTIFLYKIKYIYSVYLVNVIMLNKYNTEHSNSKFFVMRIIFFENLWCFMNMQ